MIDRRGHLNDLHNRGVSLESLLSCGWLHYRIYLLIRNLSLGNNFTVNHDWIARDKVGPAHRRALLLHLAWFDRPESTPSLVLCLE